MRGLRRTATGMALGALAFFGLSSPVVAASPSTASCTPAVNPPAVVSLSPNAGPDTGGTEVLIKGTSFECASSVLFGTVAAPFSSVSSTSIVAKSPAQPVNNVDVRVVTPVGTSPITPGDFYYYLSAWQAWEAHGGVLASGPTASTWGPGRTDAFLQGTDGQLWHRWTDTGGPWNWEPLGGSPTSDASAISPWRSGVIHVFIRGPDLALWENTYGNGLWAGWQSLGGRLASEPSATFRDTNTIDVFVQGLDNHLWHWNSSNGAPSWTDLGGVLASAPAAAALAPTTTELYAFVKGADGQLWEWYDAIGPSHWVALGGRLGAKPSAMTGQDPAATAGQPIRVDVFVRGVDSSVWHWNNLHGWEGLGGRMLNWPDGVTVDGQHLNVFVRGTDNHLWHAWWTPQTPWTWEDLGGVIVAAPAATAESATADHVYVEGADSALWGRAFG